MFLDNTHHTHALALQTFSVDYDAYQRTGRNVPPILESERLVMLPAPIATLEMA
jgi:hypothetical protein